MPKSSKPKAETSPKRKGHTKTKASGARANSKQARTYRIKTRIAVRL